MVLIVFQNLTFGLATGRCSEGSCSSAVDVGACCRPRGVRAKDAAEAVGQACRCIGERPTARRTGEKGTVCYPSDLLHVVPAQRSAAWAQHHAGCGGGPSIAWFAHCFIATECAIPNGQADGIHTSLCGCLVPIKRQKTVLSISMRPIRCMTS